MRMKRFLLSCLSCSMLSGAGAAETVNLAADAEISSRANPDRVELIRDGRLDRDHTLPGSIYLEKPAGWGDEITLRWPEAKRITGVAAFRAAPAAFPEYADADRIEVFAADAAGNFSIPVVLAVPGEWRAEKFNGQAAEVLRYDELNVATTALQVKFLRPGGTWSQLGELEVYGGPAGDVVPEERRAAAPEIQPLPDSPAVIAAGHLVVWSENPWRDTKGGTLGVPDAPLLGNWTMPMLRGDIEQKMIGISNRSDAPVTFRVAAASTLPENTAKCDLLVVTPIKTREHGDALLNLFAADQLRGFGEKLPPSFLDQEIYRNYPEITLPPGRQVRLWLRIAAFVGESTPEPGDYTATVTLTGEDGRLLTAPEIAVRVLGGFLPRHPSRQVMTYGGAEAEDDKLHYSTVNEGFRDYVFNNFLSTAGLWGVQDDLAALSATNPKQLNAVVAAGLEKYYGKYLAEGMPEERILVEILDEPFDRTADKWVAVARAIRAVKPDARLIANPPAHWPEGNMPTTLDGTFRKLAPYVDVWMPYSRHYEDPEVEAFLRSTGKPLWFYNNCAVQHARDESAFVPVFRRFGWLAIAKDLDGLGFWSAYFPVGDPWDDFDRTEVYTWPDAAVVFRDYRGRAIPTRNWESWREGIEDGELYRLIRHALAALELSRETREDMERFLVDAPRIMLEEPTPENIEKIHAEAYRLLQF